MTVTPEVATGLVLVAAAFHATWNALLKKSSEYHLEALAMIIGTGGAMALLITPFVGWPPPKMWPILCGSAALHVIYYVLLATSYRFGDLSHVYPIARGLAPAIVALASPILIGETLSTRELLAILTICLGIASLALVANRRGAPPDTRTATGFALATGVFIAAYTIVDGLGARSGNPWTYIAWMNVTQGIPLFASLLFFRRRRYLEFLKREGARPWIGGVIATLAYAIVVWLFSTTSIAPIAALRETSVLLATWIGTRLLGEPFGRARLVAAAVVLLGIFWLRW